MLERMTIPRDSSYCVVGDLRALCDRRATSKCLQVLPHEKADPTQVPPNKPNSSNFILMIGWKCYYQDHSRTLLTDRDRLLGNCQQPMFFTCRMHNVNHHLLDNGEGDKCTCTYIKNRDIYRLKIATPRPLALKKLLL